MRCQQKHPTSNLQCIFEKGHRDKCRCAARLDPVNEVESYKRKCVGMAQAAATGAVWLDEVLRPIARKLCKIYGDCTADDVHSYCVDNRIDVPKGPFWGPLFKSGEFAWTGETRKSKQVKNHGRDLYVWKLVRASVEGAQ